MLWLSSLITTISIRKLNKLIEIFDTARGVFMAKHEEFISRFPTLTSNAIKTINERRNFDYIENMLKLMEQNSMAFFSRNNEKYPDLLKKIPEPPLGIFCIGELPADDTHKIAIIGSRKCSEYGLLATRLLAKPLASTGVVIVSGMARGVDSMAHRGALDGKGKTIAVLGTSAEICYPKENKNLREEIIKNGCLISEYPPGTTPQPAYFPARNRIISGLSSAVVVTEAKAKSGTLITVDQAMDQGREVMAVPGNISSKLSEGTNGLIREGATPVSSYEDILFALGIKKNEKSSLDLQKKSHLAPEEKQVYDILDFDPVEFDILIEKTNLGLGKLHLLCTNLEIKGLIKKLPGGRYVKI